MLPPHRSACYRRIGPRDVWRARRCAASCTKAAPRLPLVDELLLSSQDPRRPNERRLQVFRRGIGRNLHFMRLALERDEQTHPSALTKYRRLYAIS